MVTITFEDRILSVCLENLFGEIDAGGSRCDSSDGMAQDLVPRAVANVRHRVSPLLDRRWRPGREEGLSWGFLRSFGESLDTRGVGQVRLGVGRALCIVPVFLLLDRTDLLRVFVLLVDSSEEVRGLARALVLSVLDVFAVVPDGHFFARNIVPFLVEDPLGTSHFVEYHVSEV
jgi:hypothetical protein